MYAAADLMTREVVTLRETDDLGLAEDILALGRIRHLPVTDETGRLLGLVTHRDLLESCMRRTKDARTLRAREAMTRDVMTVQPGTPLRRAAQLLLRHKFGCLPVIDEDGVLVGLITEADLVRFALGVIMDLDRAAAGMDAAMHS